MPDDVVLVIPRIFKYVNGAHRHAVHRVQHRDDKFHLPVLIQIGVRPHIFNLNDRIRQRGVGDCF